MPEHRSARSVGEDHGNINANTDKRLPTHSTSTAERNPPVRHQGKCSTNTSCSWSCVRLSYKHIRCTRRVCLLVARTFRVGCGVRCGSTWSVLLSVLSGYFVARWNAGAHAGCSRHSATGGRRVMRARHVFWSL